MVKRALLAIIVGLATMTVGAEPSLTHQLPRKSIVNGHRLQPRDGDLRALGRPDVTEMDDDDIARLYRELLHCKGSATDSRCAR